MRMRTCPHCGVAVDDSRGPAAFCEHCGKALPALYTTGPRVVGAGTFAATQAGQELQARDLARQAKKAATALLAVALIQLILGGLVVFLLKKELQAADAWGLALAEVFGVGTLYLGLFFWARQQPLPPAIVGLVVYVTLQIATAIHVGPEALWKGILVKVIIIVVLARAIGAGVQHRRLLQQSATRSDQGYPEPEG